MTKVYSIGETTYDIIFKNDQPSGAVVGGSVLNTSVTLGRLGVPVSFVSRMGSDQIGDISMKFLRENGVNCDYITRFEGSSRLALAFLDNENNADYSFYKAGKAPALRFPELDLSDKIVFGSTNAVRDEGRNSLLLFLNQAHDKNVLTLYDPNIREFNELELKDVRRKFEENLYLTKVLKGSNQDFQRLYSTDNADEIFEKVRMFGVEVLVVTHGAEPVELRTKKLSLNIEISAVQTISTIGAGDNFTAGLVFGFERLGIDTNGLKTIEEEDWRKILRCASSFSSEVCRSNSNYISKQFVEAFLVQNVCN